MNELARTPVLLLDCQTTGMRPSSSRILEIAWCVFAEGEPGPMQTRLIRLPEGEVLSRRISEITGIAESDLQSGRLEHEVLSELHETMKELNKPLRAVAHYAQFERAFVESALEKTEAGLRPEWICSQRLAKRLFPELPSQNLRAMAGFFGAQLPELKRAGDHLHATIVVWKSILSRLHAAGVDDWTSLSTFLKEKSKPKVTPYRYHVEKLLRLSLPDKPGIYRMLAQDGKILYVGKATSLKSRVNSYFRGQKGRDRRKLEMLAQVWDLRVTECETPLEAALLETDEIKRWDPPYNVSLKRGNRELVFYDRDFLLTSGSQTAATPIGPFRHGSVLESLRALHDWLVTGNLGPIFYQELDSDLVAEGFEIFCVQWGLRREELADFGMRCLLSLGMLEFRKFLQSHEDDIEAVFARQKAEKDQAEELTAEAVAGKFERLFLRSAVSLRRVRRMTRLLNCEVFIKTRHGERRLAFANGRFRTESASERIGRWAWASADIADYDRMSILLGEVEKRRLKVCFAI